jgi:hypothetical protein
MDSPYDLNLYPEESQERGASRNENINGSIPVPRSPGTGSLEHTDTITSGGTGFPPIQPVERPAIPPPRPLTKWDVASLIINKMIGTGIFTAPWTVLSMTRSPGLALGLWIIGFIYTGIRFEPIISYARLVINLLDSYSMLVYLEFARKLPHTGGELIYVSKSD